MTIPKMNKSLPLTGHTSPETAYVVDDYPYGFRLRCKIRYWLETHPKKGTRFVSQTTNPKQPIEVWNKPKASTYTKITAAMYLDENGHVTWDGISEYTDAVQALAFAKLHGGGTDAQGFKVWCAMKAKYEEASARGEIVWTINGQPRPDSEAETEEHRKDAVTWRQVLSVLSGSCKVHTECVMVPEIGKACLEHASP